jgi:subtilase family serine protease
LRCRRPRRFDLRCEALESRQLLSAGAAGSAIDALTAQPGIQASPLITTGPTGSNPQQIQAAYGVDKIAFSGGTVSGTGAGQTIAIVVANHDPNIGADLDAFDSQFGLSAPPKFTVANLGATTTDPGWALETSLDVEWAHALAPSANILLVEAPSASLGDLFNAVTYASAQPGVSVVSMSWGSSEFWGEWYYNNVFTTPSGHNNVAFVAASGDSGAWSGPTFPSVSPNVLAVGATTLTLTSGGSYGSETGWTGSTGGFSGLDSGFQYGLAEPSYQTATLTAAGLNFGLRTTPDVSLDGDPASGVAVYDSVSSGGQSGWYQVGGTSAAAPAWAGLVAVADQGLALGGQGTLSSNQLLTDLYSLPQSDFNPITSGFNGYSAQAGYNLVTGLGTPKANLLVTDLLADQGVRMSVIAAPSGATGSGASVTSSSHQTVRASTSSSNGPGSGSGTSTSLGSTASSTATAAPTATGQAVNASSVSAFGTTSVSSAQMPTTLAAPVQSAASPITAAPPSLGQGLTAPSTSTRWGASAADPGPAAPIDSPEAETPGATNPPAEPSPEPAPTPAQAPTPEAIIAPAQPASGRSSDGPARDDPDGLGDRAAESLLPAGPRPIPPESEPTRGVRAPHGVSAAFGAAVIAVGGYRLVHRRSDQKGKRHPAHQLGRHPV